MAPKTKIEELEISNINVEFIHKTTKPIRLGNLVGNKFRIKITDSDKYKNKIDGILEQLDGGFPNYFGIQRLVLQDQ